MHYHRQSSLIHRLIHRIHSIPIQILCFTMLKHTNQLCFNPYLFTMYSIAWSIAMPMYILCLSMLWLCITYVNHVSCLCIAMLTICYTYACVLLMLWVLCIYCTYAYTLSMLSIAYHSYTLCIIVYRCSLSSYGYAINNIYINNAIHSPPPNTFQCQTSLHCFTLLVRRFRRVAM